MFFDYVIPAGPVCGRIGKPERVAEGEAEKGDIRSDVAAEDRVTACRGEGANLARALRIIDPLRLNCRYDSTGIAAEEIGANQQHIAVPAGAIGDMAAKMPLGIECLN